MRIVEIFEGENKATICNDILRMLPSWFGIESSITDYVSQVQKMPFYVAYENEVPIGFVALKVHNKYTAEVCVMGILKEFHRQGIGKDLIRACEKYCCENDFEFLTVKTLDASSESESYEKTRLFYSSMGFKPLEIFPLLWDKDNPCLFLAKHINPEKRTNHFAFI